MKGDSPRCFLKKVPRSSIANGEVRGWFSVLATVRRVRREQTHETSRYASENGIGIGTEERDRVAKPTDRVKYKFHRIEF